MLLFLQTKKHHILFPFGVASKSPCYTLTLSESAEWSHHSVACVVQMFERESGGEGDRRAGEMGRRRETRAAWHLCIGGNYICRNCSLGCATRLHDGLRLKSHPSLSVHHHTVRSTYSIWTCREDRSTLWFSICLRVSGRTRLWLRSAQSAHGCSHRRLQSHFGGLALFCCKVNRLIVCLGCSAVCLERT